jgi:hypothetical protein
VRSTAEQHNELRIDGRYGNRHNDAFAPVAGQSYRPSGGGYIRQDGKSGSIVSVHEGL